LMFGGLMVTAILTVSARAAEPPEQQAARMQWFREAKFGMFIHWGVYSQAGGVWKGTTNHAEWLQLTAKIPIAEYTQLAKQFNPVKFNADQWAQIASDAGMKYLVITSKHHDGFAMFDSPSDPYNIVKATPFGRDPLKELAAACRKNGLKFCVYYSLGRDWHDPDVPTGSPGNAKFPPGSRSNLIDFPDESKKVFAKYFERKVKPQVRELLTQYGPIGILWFDTPEKITAAQSAELRDMIRGLQPDCIVNARVGHGLGDYGTPEQQIPSAKSTKAWETCMTLNGHWGYNSHDEKWKSTATLLTNLIDITSKGGNYLLNVGPTGEGLIPQPSTERLGEIGAWLKVNGEAIYGAGMTPFGAELGKFSDTKLDKKTGKPLFIPGDEWRCTTKPGKFYFFLLKWPSEAFTVSGLKGTATKAYLLADSSRTPLSITQEGAKLAVTLPAGAPGKYANVLCVEIAPPLKGDVLGRGP
jgi:alpha-L-fucosidase